MTLDSSDTQSFFGLVSDSLKRQVLAFQDYTLLAVRAIANIFTPPWYWTDTMSQIPTRATR